MPCSYVMPPIPSACTTRPPTAGCGRARCPPARPRAATRSWRATCTPWPARRAAGAEPPQEVRVRDWAAQADRLYTALMAGDEALARHDFDRLAAGTPVVGLCDQVIAPALRRVGAAWAAGEVSIAEEHRATAICERLIAARARQPQGRPRGIAVTTTPPGEQHALPA